MQKFLPFLHSQRLLTLATRDEKSVWAASVYFGTDDSGVMYFISPQDTLHSKMILTQPEIAFTCAWFDLTNHKNRKAIQGRGVCVLATTDEEIAAGVALHNKNFPEFANKITPEWIRTNEWGSRVWVLRPTYIKYWDDEVYKDEESEEFVI